MMTNSLRHFLRDDSLSPTEQAEVLELALELKADRLARPVLAGPSAVAILFDKPSTRTRVSFSIGVAELGGYPLVIEAAGSQIGRGESIEDTARILDRQCDAIVWRTSAQGNVERMAAVARVPVINALTDDFHPCQVLADLLTVAEYNGGLDTLAGLKLAYLGDGANNMAQSYLLGGALAGMHVAIGAPASHQPRPDIVAAAQAIAASSGGSVLVTDDPAVAAVGANAVATDTWVSMGMEAESDQRRDLFGRFQVDQALMDQADPDAVVLHCLPAYRGQEITAEVLDGPQSVIWDEAENRLHVQKALLVWLLEGA